MTNHCLGNWLALIVLTAEMLSAAGLATGGNEFFIGFFENFPSRTREHIFLSVTTNEELDTPYTVTNRGSILYAGVVKRGLVDIVPLSPNLIVQNSMQRQGGIHIKAKGNKTIIVYGFNEQIASTDAFLALPATKFPDTPSYTYYATATDSARHSRTSEVLIVGTENSTVLTITASQMIIGPLMAFMPNQPRTIVINRLETLLLKSRSDLSGTKVVSNKPVSFFSGQQCAEVPKTSGFCDILVEQIPPVETWGNRFVTAPLATRLRYDVFQFHGAEDGTVVYAHCRTYPGNQTRKFNFAIGSGDKAVRQIRSNEYCWIESTKRILIVQLSVGSTVDGVDADPFMVIVPPVNLYTNGYTFASGQSKVNTYSDYMNLLVTKPFFQTDNIHLDGIPLSSFDIHWVAVYSRGSSEPQAFATQIRLSSGTHTIQHSNPLGKLGVFVYGFGEYISYGYLAGMEVEYIGTIDPVSTTITNVTDSSISVDWKEPITNSSGVFFYDVKVSLLDDKEREVPVLSTTTTETEITVKNLPSDTIVSVLISAKVEEDNSTIRSILPTVARVATTLPKAKPHPSGNTSAVPRPLETTSAVLRPLETTSAVPLPSATTSAVSLPLATTSAVSRPSATTSSVPHPSTTTSGTTNIQLSVTPAVTVTSEPPSSLTALCKESFLPSIRRFAVRAKIVVHLHWEVPECAHPHVKGQYVAYQKIDSEGVPKGPLVLLPTGNYNKNYVIHGLQSGQSYNAFVVLTLRDGEIQSKPVAVRI